MKFVVSSTELLSHLNAISRVISNKNTMPILDNFLFQLQGNELTITASDTETTLITHLDLENTDGDGLIAIPAKIMIDTLKEFPEQPLTFQIDAETYAIDIFSQNGKFSIVGQNGEDFPELPQIDADNASSILLSQDILMNGINKTLFATADDELRPIMNGIFVELSTEGVTFVASDAHKLVRYKRSDAKAENDTSFILPKKPSGLLKNLLPKEEGDIKLEFDNKNAFFSLTNFKMVCRLLEGVYPAYNSVIPAENPNHMIINRQELANSLKRVSVFSNQASNLVKLKLSANQVVVSAQDIDFSISAVEHLNCQYEGDEMEIGFKSVFLIEILSNIDAAEVRMELSDPTRAGILIPEGKDNEDEDVLMLIMPMMINI